MKEVVIVISCLFFLGVSCDSEDFEARNVTKLELAKDLQGHLDYLLTVVAQNNTAVKDFLLMEAKVAGDFERSWYERKNSIVKYLEQDRKVMEWLKSWRSGDAEDAADYFINAAENYKDKCISLLMEGSDLMKNTYTLLYDPEYNAASKADKISMIWAAIGKADPCPPGNFCDI